MVYRMVIYICRNYRLNNDKMVIYAEYCIQNSDKISDIYLSH
jgi:hypothetical protein